MAKKLVSVELNLYGVAHTFDFSDEPIAVQGEDEMEVGREVLENVESYEVQLKSGGVERLSFSVDYTISGSVELELAAYELADYGWDESKDPEDLDTYDIASDLDDYIREAIAEDAGRNGDIEFDITDVDAE